MHGDIFSNDRLDRFGLRQDAKCANCDELTETIMHKVRDCPKAFEAWRELEEAKAVLNLNTLTDLTIENLIGAKENVNKIEHALQAELIHRLTSINVSYCPRRLVKTVIQFVGYTERLNAESKELFNEAIRNWG